MTEASSETIRELVETLEDQIWDMRCAAHVIAQRAGEDGEDGDLAGQDRFKKARAMEAAHQEMTATLADILELTRLEFTVLRPH